MISKSCNVVVMCCFLLIISPGFCLAELIDGNATRLEAITVQGKLLMPVSEESVTTRNYIGQDRIGDLHLKRTSSLLKEIPGVDIGNYYQGGVANPVRMRGFSTGAHGTDMAIVANGIPLTDAAGIGYGGMNVLVPLNVEEVEVSKGPSSVLYGNLARAGAISFQTRKGGEYTKLNMDYGSYETTNVQSVFGTELGNAIDNNSAIQLYYSDGYRENQRWLRQNVSTRFSGEMSKNLKADLLLRFHGSQWDAPGYLPRAQYKHEDQCKYQAKNAENDGGDKLYFSEKLNLSYRLSPGWELSSWGYGTQKEFTRFAKYGYDPGGQTEDFEEIKQYGTGGKLKFDRIIASYPIDGFIGAEYYQEIAESREWDTENRVRQALSRDRRTDLERISLFGEINAKFSQYFRPHLGLRYDSYDGEFTNHDPNTSYKKDIQEYKELNPKLGFRSRIVSSLDFRASYSQGSALPNEHGSNKLISDLKCEEVKQYELGMTYTPFSRFWLDMAGYILDTEDEIQENPPYSGNFENMGKTRRRGLETALRYSPIDNLKIFGELSVTDTEILDSANATMEGRELSGNPEYTTNMGMKYSPPSGLGGRVKWRKLGKWWIDDQNKYSYPGHDVLNARISYTFNTKNKRFSQYKVFLNLENALDEHYAKSIWYGYGSRNYAPAWPRTVYLGMEIDI